MPKNEKTYYKSLKRIWILLLAMVCIQCRTHSPDDVYVQATSSFEETTLERSEEATAQTPFAEISPLINGIVFVSDRDGNNEIYVMNADGSQPTRLTNNEVADSSPVWSPDGEKIAFVSYRDNNFELFVMNADGSQLTRLTDNQAFDGHPNWSFNGEHIAFASDRDGNMEIYTMKPDGNAIKRLTNHLAIDTSPSWSPDDQDIVFSSTRDSLENGVNSELYMIDTEGNQPPTRLTNNPSSDNSPVWSPNGQYIVFVSDRDSVRGRVPKLYIMDTNSLEIARINDDDMTVLPVPHEFAPAWSPDGQRLVFSLDDGDSEIFVYDFNSHNMSNLSNNEATDYEPDWRP